MWKFWFNSKCFCFTFNDIPIYCIAMFFFSLLVYVNIFFFLQVKSWTKIFTIIYILLLRLDTMWFNDNRFWVKRLMWLQNIYFSEFFPLKIYTLMTVSICFSFGVVHYFNSFWMPFLFFCFVFFSYWTLGKFILVSARF